MFLIFRDRHSQKGQVAPFLIIISAILILAIIATNLIGEAAFQRLRLGNITDSGAISAASAFCRGLNQIRISHAQMLISYIQLQAALLFSSPWPSKSAGYAAAVGWGLIGIDANKRLYDQAQGVAKDMPKNLRTSLYDSVFGGALIDEPRPFLDTGDAFDEKGIPVYKDDQDEVLRDPTGKIVGLNYTRYLKRQSHFEKKYLNFRKENYVKGFPIDQKNWYMKDTLSYSFNKKKSDASEPEWKGKLRPGKLIVGEPDASYASYLKTTITAPKSVSVRPQRMVLIFFYCTPSGCWTPGIIPHPYAWIRRIDMQGNTIGAAVTKSSANSLSGGKTELNHTSTARIRGSLSTGYDFVLEK